MQFTSSRALSLHYSGQHWRSAWTANSAAFPYPSSQTQKALLEKAEGSYHRAAARLRELQTSYQEGSAAKLLETLSADVGNLRGQVGPTQSSCAPAYLPAKVHLRTDLQRSTSILRTINKAGSSPACASELLSGVLRGTATSLWPLRRKGSNAAPT